MEPYLCNFRDGEKIYYLNKEGRERVNCNIIRNKSVQVRHYLMRNELYIQSGQPSTWRNEIKFGIESVAMVVADAIFQRDGVHNVVEVDHLQKMSKNRAKIEKYRLLREVGPFNLVWITTTEYRRKQLEKLCNGLDVKIFTIKDFK
jgi:hypothetical protein